MGSLTEEEFKELYVTTSATEISAGQYAQCLNAGFRMVKKYVGDDSAEEVVAATEPYSSKVSDLREAQGKLAFRELLLIVSSRFKDGGIIESEKDLNDTSVNKYEGFDNIQKRRAALLGEAVEILEVYSIPDAPDAFEDMPNYSMTLSRVVRW